MERKAAVVYLEKAHQQRKKTVRFRAVDGRRGDRRRPPAHPSGPPTSRTIGHAEPPLPPAQRQQCLLAHALGTVLGRTHLDVRRARAAVAHVDLFGALFGVANLLGTAVLDDAVLDALDPVVRLVRAAGVVRFRLLAPIALRDVAVAAAIHNGGALHPIGLRDGARAVDDLGAPPLHRLFARILAHVRAVAGDALVLVAGVLDGDDLLAPARRLGRPRVTAVRAVARHVLGDALIARVGALDGLVARLLHVARARGGHILFARHVHGLFARLVDDALLAARLEAVLLALVRLLDVARAAVGHPLGAVLRARAVLGDLLLARGRGRLGTIVLDRLGAVAGVGDGLVTAVLGAALFDPAAAGVNAALVLVHGAAGGGGGGGGGHRRDDGGGDRRGEQHLLEGAHGGRRGGACLEKGRKMGGTGGRLVAPMPVGDCC